MKMLQNPNQKSSMMARNIRNVLESYTIVKEMSVEISKKIAINTMMVGVGVTVQMRELDLL